MNIVSNPPFPVKARQNHDPSPTQVQPAVGGGAHSTTAVTATQGPESGQCLVLTWRDWKLTRKTITLAEAMTLRPEDVDFQWDLINQRLSFQPKEGPRRRYEGRIPKVGDDVGEPLLRKIILWVPRPVDGMCLAADSWLRHLVGNALNQRAKNMRWALGESGSQPWFILTARGGYRWNPERSWRLIEMFPAASNRAG